MSTKMKVSKRLFSSMQLEAERAEKLAVAARAKADEKKRNLENVEVEPDGRKKVVTTGEADANQAQGTGSVEA